MNNERYQETRAMQMLVTGMLLGSLMKDAPSIMDVEIVPLFDDEDMYKPEFLVRGKKSGIQLRVTVGIDGDEGA
jgi:hypothetical protein